MASKAKRNARFISLAITRLSCHHDWYVTGSINMVVFRVCRKCGLEEEKDVS